MSNVHAMKNKVVKITLLDGVERKIKFDLNAMAELEDRYGSVQAAFDMLDKNSIKAVRFILWAGLIHEDPDLTEQKVGSLIDMPYLQNLMSTLGQAFQADMPEQTEEPEVTNPNA
jgi:hypothetical protein